MSAPGGGGSPEKVAAPSAATSIEGTGVGAGAGGPEESFATGLIYDARMMLHEDTTGPHPEQPARIEKIFEMLELRGLADRCERVKAREATQAELERVHQRRYLEKVLTWPEESPHSLIRIGYSFSSIYLNPHTTMCALLSAGSVVEATLKVARGDLQNAVAVVRPPGHHAEAPEAMGFCIYNNVAVAAAAALDAGLTRVLIVDWDVHHGNGTQHMFERDPRVLYFSTHRYENAAFYPGSRDAAATAVGVGDGAGYNINIAFNNGPKGDGDYLAAWHHVLLPLATEYDPELVIVSAGFDAAFGDPLGGYRVTPPGYAHLTHLLKTFADGKIVVALEGGYNLDSISESMAAVTATLLGDKLPKLPGPSFPSVEGQKAVAATLRAHAPYWHGLAKPGRPAPADSDSTESDYEEESDAEPAAVAATTTEDTKPDYTAATLSEELGKGFSVNPLAVCDHVEDCVKSVPATIDINAACSECDNTEENWVCLCCTKVFCGRYANGHMAAHYESTKHAVASSFADLSFWCYEDDAYLNNYKIWRLRPWYNKLHMAKFGELPAQSNLSLTVEEVVTPPAVAGAAPGADGDAEAPMAPPSQPGLPPQPPAAE